MDNQQERRETAIRLAAFFEGEGTFIISVFEKGGGTYQLTPVIRAGNCDPEAIAEMSRILNLHGVGHRIYTQKKYKFGHAQVAVLGIEGFKRVEKFLEVFGDFFFGRKRANIKLWRKYLPQLRYDRTVRLTEQERVQRKNLVKELKQANQELNRLGVSRILIDYTPDALCEDIVSSAARVAVNT